MKKIKKILLGFSALIAFNIFSINSFAMKQNNNGKIIENSSKNNRINTNVKRKKYILGNSSKNNRINTNVKKKKYICNRKNNDLNEAINTQQPSFNFYETRDQKLKTLGQQLKEFEQRLEAIRQALEAFNAYNEDEYFDDEYEIYDIEYPYDEENNSLDDTMYTEDAYDEE